MSETTRDVFNDLLDTFSHQHTDDDYPIIEQSWWPDWRAEQLARFDLAGWIGVEERLPPDTSTIDFWVERLDRGDGVDRSSCERGYYYTDGIYRWVADHIHGEIGRYCPPGTEKVTHWRPIAPPPVNRRKIERADVGT